MAKEWCVNPRRLTNPSRLVFGETAILSVGANGQFNPTEVDWQVIDGPGRPLATNGWQFTVEPTADSGTVIVEARFNTDEVQPRFVLPVVREHVFDIKMFVTCNVNGARAAENEELEHLVRVANSIYRQVGVGFNLKEIRTLANSSRYWRIPAVYEKERYMLFFSKSVLAPQVLSLLGEYQRMPDYHHADCIEVYVVNQIENSVNGFRLPGGIVISGTAPDQTLAHELGHALGLADCYMSCMEDNSDPNSEMVSLPGRNGSIKPSFFISRPNDWGEESGSGFYSSRLAVPDVYMRLLMFGEEDYAKRNGVDLPDSGVLCVQGNALGYTGIGFAPVGASNINTNTLEVYTR